MIHPARLLWKMSRTGGVALLALSCCACAGPHALSRFSSSKSDSEPADNGPVQAVYRQTVSDRGTVRRGQSDSLYWPPAGVVRLSKRPATTTVKGATEAAIEVRHEPDLTLPSRVENISHTSRTVQPRLSQHVATRAGVQQVSHSQFGDINCPPFTITQCPPDARWSSPSPNPFAQGMLGCQCETATLAEKFPDEYLCDGGDRALPVHYDQFSRNGLDTEDTVAEFTDHHGKQRIRASNRVCVYAPRFSTVRTISRPHEGMNLDESARVGHSIGTDQMHTRLKPSLHVKNEMSGRVRVRSRASGLESEQLQGNVSNVKRLAVHEKLLNVYQDLNFVQFGKLETRDAARLNFGIQASLIWTREEYPVIAAKTEIAMTGTYEAHAATIVGIDDKKSDEPGNLRLVKLADKQSVQPGDVVEFTLRYDNQGANTVQHVRIVDNLTPRLAYVEDSATSDRDGRLVVHDNGEGSLVLVWELTNPLPPQTGGVVSFKARVR